jgi:hypothetical protein
MTKSITIKYYHINGVNTKKMDSEDDSVPIKKFELTSIEARRFSKSGETHKNIRIDHNSSVTYVNEINEGEAHIDFRFTANYSGLGLIKIEGSMVYEGDAKGLANQWKAKNNLPNEIASEIHSTVMTNCIPEAMLLARDIRLPPPIPLPKVNIKAQKKGGEPGGYA